MFWEKKNFTKLRYEEFHVNIGKAHWKRITLKILSNKEFVFLTKLKGLWQVCFYRSDEKYCQPLKKYVNSSQGQGLSTARDRATSKPQPTSISAFCPPYQAFSMALRQQNAGYINHHHHVMTLRTRHRQDENVQQH